MKPLIDFQNVQFAYNDRPVLENINLHLHPGQFAALVGPSGAGKTTLLKLVLGLKRPLHGQISTQTSPPLRIAYVPQIETVDWNFPVTAEEVVLMGVRQSGWPWSSKAERKQANDILEKLGIVNMANRHIRNLSGGQQQRIFLARALIANPDLLILDEPTSGIDLRSAESIFHQLVSLNQEGMTILLTTHDLNMAAAHAPWVICLNQKIIAQGTPENVMTDAILSQAYQGDMLVIRQNDTLFIQQKPHTHSYHDLIPEPVAGGLPGHDLKDEG